MGSPTFTTVIDGHGMCVELACLQHKEDHRNNDGDEKLDPLAWAEEREEANEYELT